MARASQPSYVESRPYTLPPALEELQGPDSGIVELPRSLAWSGKRTYDAGDQQQAARMYKIVLEEAQQVDQLRRYVNGGLLRHLWRNMALARPVRKLWEQRFPELAL
jgi:hypothetical protein